jgi:starch phosphorylase
MQNISNLLANARVAYFSMEIALNDQTPTYSGGLGVLAGDTIKAAADLGVPMVAVTLLYRKGYFQQQIDPKQGQSEAPVQWSPEKLLQEQATEVTIQIEKRNVKVKAWCHEVKGATGKTVPVLFLDTAIASNSNADQELVDCLYGGDNEYRIRQEILLGIGGVKILRSLGASNLQKFHMNEGHASFLTLELLDEIKKCHKKDTIGLAELEALKKQCVFTTHTPVPAGHDRFGWSQVLSNLGDVFESWEKTKEVDAIKQKILEKEGDYTSLNMTLLALNLSSYINGVAKKHGEVSREMFPGYEIDSVTNGIHVGTWLSKPFQNLFDEYLTGWREDSNLIRNAQSIPAQKVWETHQKSKQLLIDKVNSYGHNFSVDKFTIGFARRFATYKRADLLFFDVAKLKSVAEKFGGIQLVFSGKAHPKDEGGKQLIKNILKVSEELGDKIKLAFLPNYNMELGGLITSGSDIWLNNPKRPLEASGTSGMKAALNAVPNFSILDGWWIEGHIEGLTGWSIGNTTEVGTDEADRKIDAESIYKKLEEVILPLYNNNKAEFIKVMQHSQALCGSYFHTQRMVQDYITKAYFN